MSNANTFEDLESWQKARELSLEIFLKTQIAPFSMDHSLKDQINRSSGSVSDNIAEGFERNGNKEFAFSLTISKGSAGEMRSQLHRAYDRKYLNIEEYEDLKRKAFTLSRMIWKLRQHIIQSDLKGSRFRKSNSEE
jgi:four helix bundle protein